MKVNRLFILIICFVICSAILLTSCVKNDSAENSEDSGEIIENAVMYYGSYGEEADGRIEELLNRLKATDPVSYKKWDSVMNLWHGIEDTEINYDILPDGLPTDSSLCIVALGFQLNPDGTIKDELVERLTVVLNSAKKYPNAYIVCTGGGTASENESATEAGKMAEWLIENGLSEDRIIVENKSLTTAQNAIFTYDILKSDYPEVNKVAIVSSNYHIATGTLFFQSEFILKAEGEAPDINVVTNAACDCPTGTLSRMFQAGGLIELNGNKEKAFSVYYDEYDIHELPPLE